MTWCGAVVMGENMTEEKKLSEEELENLRKEVIESYRKNYRCTFDLLDNLVEISKGINIMMKTLHESLSELERLFSEFFVEENYHIIYEAVTPEDIERMLGSMSSLIDEVNTMGDYTTSITEDVGKVLHADD